MTGFAHKWYMKPLGDEDGNTFEEIAAAERRLGIALPQAVREWYLLAGRRVATADLVPVPLDGLCVEGSEPVVTLYRYPPDYGLRGWSFQLSDQQPDPTGLGSGQVLPTVSEMLLLLVLRDTIVGAMKAGRGPFGELRPEVRVGHSREPDARDADAVAEAYPALPLPVFKDPSRSLFHGDSDTLALIWREFDPWVSALARNEGAWERLADVIDLEEPFFDAGR